MSSLDLKNGIKSLDFDCNEWVDLASTRNQSFNRVQLGARPITGLSPLLDQICYLLSDGITNPVKNRIKLVKPVPDGTIKIFWIQNLLHVMLSWVPCLLCTCQQLAIKSCVLQLSLFPMFCSFLHILACLFLHILQLHSLMCPLQLHSLLL